MCKTTVQRWCTVDLKIFVLWNFCMTNFQVEKFLQEQPRIILTLIVCMRFRKINFRSCHWLQNICTTKISRFMVHWMSKHQAVSLSMLQINFYTLIYASSVYSWLDWCSIFSTVQKLCPVQVLRSYMLFLFPSSYVSFRRGNAREYNDSMLNILA